MGNVVGASWKGVQYIRSLPSSVRNPRTQKQRMQRNKFSLIAKFVKSVLPVIRVGFRNSAGKANSAFSAAVSYNIHHAVKGEYPGYEIDYRAAALSRGGLYAANSVTAACEAGLLNFDWDTAVINNASALDRVMVIAYHPGRQEAVYDMDAGTRGEGSGSLGLPPAWEGDEVETFVVFISEEGTLVSDTIYTGRHEVNLG